MISVIGLLNDMVSGASPVTGDFRAWPVEQVPGCAHLYEQSRVLSSGAYGCAGGIRVAPDQICAAHLLSLTLVCYTLRSREGGEWQSPLIDRVRVLSHVLKS